MPRENVVSLLPALPDDASCNEALGWIERPRRTISRWEELPAAQTEMMPRETAELALAELDLIEARVRRNERRARFG
jgi:hypothetical protein